MKLSLTAEYWTERKESITTLSSIADTHLVLNCRCGHVGQIAVSDLPAQMFEADNIFVAHNLALSDSLGV